MFDITGRELNHNDKMVDCDGMSYRVVVDGTGVYAQPENNKNIRYFLYQERIERNRFKIV